jgi:beta-galactosidase
VTPPPPTTVVTSPPKISKQPKSHKVHGGDSVTFRVSAKGEGTLSYQWLRNGVAIAGATSRTLTLDHVFRDTDNHAHFRVIVANEAGSILSKRATLRVKSAR